jgi:hypothetical protein
MSESIRGWRTTLVVQGRTLAGGLRPVQVGIVSTGSGEHLGVRLAGDTVLLTDAGGGQLVAHIQAALAEKAEAGQS